MLQLVLSLLTLSISLRFTFALPEPIIHSDLLKLEKRDTRSGRATWYYPGLGNCGVTNTQDEPIVAISKELYDRNGGSNCGQYIEITNVQTGNTATGLVEDSCPSCGEGDIDLSPTLFEELAPLDDGVIQVSWNFQNDNSQSGSNGEKAGDQDNDENGDEEDEGNNEEDDED